jgi:putative ABC transport system permease protein
MTNLFWDVPVAWLQLGHSRPKLLAAVVGIVFADLLIWMQLGFFASAIDISTYIHRKVRGELVILNPQTEGLEGAKPFPRRQLMRAQGHSEVETATPLYTGTAQWRDPWTGSKRLLGVYGIVPHAPAIAVPGLAESTGPLHEADTCLFDTRTRSQKEFGMVLTKLKAGEPVAAEVNARRIKVVGTTTIGASFNVEGNLVTSDANFFRLFPERSLAAIDVGVVRLRPDANLRPVKADLQRIYGSDLLVLTIEEFADREKDFLLRTRPIGFIFSVGTVVGLFVGFAIVYQVLFTDVNNHLPQYATLKAIGYTDSYLRMIVLQEALILSLLGYFPGAVLAAGLYVLIVNTVGLPMYMTFGRAILIFALTVVMCGLSGLVAMRKLKQADPADVF